MLVEKNIYDLLDFEKNKKDGGGELDSLQIGRRDDNVVARVCP